MMVGRRENTLYFGLAPRHAWSAPVIEVPVCLLSNAPVVVAIAETSFDVWHTLDPSLVMQIAWK